MIRPSQIRIIALHKSAAGLLLAVSMAVLSLAARPAAAADRVVKIDSGVIEGVPALTPGVTAYLGIPYAAPPVGELRWRPPQPADPWPNVRNADRYSPACMQYYMVPLSWANFGDYEPKSEDCLYANVWTPAKSADEKLPVLVWIHGGGYFAGSATERLHHGDNLAAKGVILVSFNYRLGAFGFMAHPDLTKESPNHASGNYGLMDQVAALQWVHRNIAAFGGDPSRVTIFGESAGAGSVNCMQATPLTKGLFQGVIAESGSAFSRFGFGGGSSKSLAEAEREGVSFAQGMGANTIAEMRAIPAERILVAAKSVPFGVYAPITDGYVLPEDVYAIFSEGKQNDVPVLVGSNSDEGTVLGAVQPRGLTPELQREYDTLYPPERTVNTTAGAALWMMRTWARLEMKTGTHKAYEYYFSRAVPYPTDQKFASDVSHLGAHHGSEISYVFNNLDVRKARNWPWTKEDYGLADMMSSYWVNFATKLDPNGPGLPVWPVYDDSHPQVMHFDTKVDVIPLPRVDEFDFWDNVQNEKSAPAGQSR